MDALQAQVAELEQKYADLMAQAQARVQASDTPSKQAPTSSIVFSNSIPIPEKFSFEKEDWQVWITHYERFRTATKLDKSTQAEQINSLLLHMGAKVTKFMEAKQKQETDFPSYKALKEFFDNEFKDTPNTIYARAKFNRRDQREGEDAQTYIADVISLAKTCNYRDLEEELIRDRLVVGIRDEKLSENLQMNDKLTLKTAIDKITQVERIRTENRELRVREETVNRVARDKAKKFNHKSVKYEGKQRRSKDGKQQSEHKFKGCIRCGNSNTHNRMECPANGQTCHKCNFKGHFASRCKTKNVNAVESETSISDDTDDSYDSSYDCREIISINRVKLDKPWEAVAEIFNTNIVFKIDTGADETIISSKEFKDKLQGKVKLQRTKTTLLGPGKGNQRKLEIKGEIVVPLKWENKIENVRCFVVDTPDNLLGRPALQKLDMIKWTGKELVASDSVIRHVTSRKADEKFQHKMMVKYPEVFKGLGTLKNFEYTIEVKSDAQPWTLNTPRRIPLPMMDVVKKELDKMIREDVIEAINEPTEWCAPMVIAAKKNGKIRVCSDYTELNKCVNRELYQLPSVDETISKLKDAKWFTKLDFSSGFWQLKLSPQSRKYTCFLTPFGRYVYKRIPFGITSAPEVFQKTISGVIGKLKMEHVHVHADDILITGRNEADHDTNVNKVLTLLSDHGLTLNKSKCEFKTNKTLYLGYLISENGVQADPKSVEAINNYPAPSSVTEVRTFLGMVNYVSKFIVNTSKKTQSLRELLHKDKQFVWTDKHQADFEKLKSEIASSRVLAKFSTDKKSRVSADASSFGLGAVLEQLQSDGNWKPTYFCSRTLEPCEQAYAQIEKEALAITWACERLENFLLGAHFEIHTDHKPLTVILATKELNKLSNRLQRFRMRLLKFNYTIEYVPGKTFFVPDALSRAPIQGRIRHQDPLLEDIQNLYINFVMREVVTEICSTEEIKSYQNKDPTYSKLKEYVKNGWPQKHKSDPLVSKFFSHQQDLSIAHDIVCYKDRVVIPGPLQKKCLYVLHDGHFGINKCLDRAKATVWWPGITRELKEVVGKCEICIKLRRPTVDPMLPSEVPSRPWQTIGADLAEYHESTYLVVQDYYSKYPEIRKLRTTKAKVVIETFKEMFARHGIPEVVRSDNGKQFDCHEYRTFSRKYGFKLITSSPHYQQSNGQAESAVKLLKTILRKNEDPYLALLTYRNTPTKCGLSPAQLLFGRNLRDRLPRLPSGLKPATIDHDTVRQTLINNQAEQKSNYDKRHRVTKEEKNLKEGDRVWIINMQKEGEVQRRCEEPRSYLIETDGGCVRRNRRHLQPLPDRNNEPEHDPEQPDESEEPKKRPIRRPKRYQDYYCY
ncbi:uncharacterized protein K02A2.6-like [Tribolium castaneum]|uniref:uncharacterized protein K02A2.6-like n=1 Tax=Tribolium castaneum TaxID=7070 RepID=UPI0030FE4B6D